MKIIRVFAITFLEIFYATVLTPVTLVDGYQGSKNSSPTLPTHSFAPIVNQRYYPPISLDEDDDNGGEPNDYQVWSAIASSLAKWKEMKKRKAHKSHVHRRDEEIVCYRSVGCFRDEGPFDYLDTLPQPPEAVGTRFWLFTRELREQSEPIRYDDNGTSLHRSHFNASRAVKIIVHGFGGSGHRPWVQQMTEKLLQVVDTNVIVVDWEKGASLPNYVQAAANVQLVGRQVARLIELLNVASGVENQNIHIIGFSLGAHVAGYAGMETKNLGRISGLDPASPLFEGYDFKAKLDPSDAHFVDIIHSSGDSFLRGGLGAFESMGHVDFYPNGGKAQLGCNSVFRGALTDIFYRDWQSLCNHRRAFKFFTDSIEPSCSFPAFPCDNFDKFLRGHCFTCPPKGVPVIGGRTCGRMGYYSDKHPARGKLYLITREKEPFCANQFKIILTNTKGQGKTWGKLEVTFFAQIGDNETFLLSMESEEIDDTQPIQGVVIAHPAFRNLTGVTVRYNKYKGWIYSGKEEWHLNKIHIENSDGQKYTYCGYRTAVKDKEPLTLPLTPGNCKVDSTPHRESRLIWKVIGDPVKGNDPRPPLLRWTLLDLDSAKYSNS